MAVSSRGYGATLTWDPGGFQPADDGTGQWDLTTANWSNGTAAVKWVNDGTTAATIGNAGFRAGLITVTPGTTINAAGITVNPSFDNYDEILLNDGAGLKVNGDVAATGNNPSFPGYGPNIEVNGGTLDMTGHAMTGTAMQNRLFVVNGTLMNIGPIGNGLAPLLFSPGSSTFGGTNTWTGPTAINASGTATRLLTGGSFGNTPIQVTNGGKLTADAGTSAGSTGAGTLGASLTINTGGKLVVGGNGAAGAFTVNDEAGFGTAPLSLNGAALSFYLDASGADSLVLNGGAASVAGSNTVNLLADGTLASLTPGDTYTLISDPAGGLAGTYQETSPGLIFAGGKGYYYSLTSTPTALTATILPSPVPEPASLATLGIAGTATLLGRRRRISGR